MFTKTFQGLAVLLALLLGACAHVPMGDSSQDGRSLGLVPRAMDVPSGETTRDYIVMVYPGVGKNFNPNPKLTLEEHNDIAQLDSYCSAQTERLSGRLKEMAKQGLTYAVLEGLLGSAAARWAFGPAISVAQYFKYIAGTAAGGGLANGTITFDMAKAVTHGYCMTLMTYKADELEGQLKRIGIVPLYTGEAKLPPTGSEPAPKFEHSGREAYLPLPPR